VENQHIRMKTCKCYIVTQANATQALFTQQSIT